MNRKFRCSVLFGVLLILIFPRAHAQKVETVDGVRVVHNNKGGRWGNNPEVRLALVGTIGGLDVQDEKQAFRFPYDVVCDADGNICLSFHWQNRIEKYSADGILLGVIPLKHRAHGIRIFGDNLLIWERNDSVYYRYKIMEKN